MVAELVETSRLWGRVAARIEPQWIEPLAEHLVKRTYAEPHWERKRGSVVALERVTLYGLPIVSGRKVAYGRIDPELARELFIRRALVEGDWETRHAFFARQPRRLAEVDELEQRARRRDILAGDEALFAFYDERIPAEIVSGRALRPLVARRAPRAARPARLHARAARRRRDADALDAARAAGGVAAGRAGAAAELPLRAGRRARRRDRPRPAHGAAAAARRRVRLARARPSGRSS